ncbi:hypothetical protein IMZ48_20365 [Candidatus Bathyarchaeota archaeon]|nr:hypothetical protein [Candidatus Bathyarchaeota archaeon]
MDYLDNLPPELMLGVLYSMRTLQDLQSLIAASPSYLQVFRHHRRRVLVSVLRNAIPEDALRDTLFILNAPEPTPGHVISPPEEPMEDPSILLEGHKNRARTTASTLTRKYFSNHEFDFPSTMPELDRLARLCLLVESFTDDYALHVARKLTSPIDGTPGVGKWHPPAHFAPLSTGERARIQGAFYRYELYCRIFRCYDNPLSQARWRGDSLFSGGGQLYRFIRHMDLWKVEEMSCIYNYLHSLARGCVQELEDQVVAAVHCAALGATKTRRGKVANSPASRPYLARASSIYLEKKRADTNEIMVPFEISLDDHLGIFTSTYPANQNPHDFSGKLASYGLAYIRRLVSADIKTRSAIIRSETPFGRVFLPGALDPDDFSQMVNQATRLPAHWGGIETGTDRYSFRPSRNCIRRRGENHTPMRYKTHELLRDRGYPFWDAERYEDLVTARAFCVLFRVYVGKPRGRKGDFESVEDRVAGVTLLLGERRRIIEEFRFANMPQASGLLD